MNKQEKRNILLTNKNNNTVDVTVLCMTYNHRDYIAQALEGILNQKTKYRYKIVIHDDASTDGTTEIVKKYSQKYPDKIETIIQNKNQYKNCNISKEYLTKEIEGRYVAICEGDDFWNDPNKLNKQILFLENNTDYCMTFHSVYRINKNNSITKYIPFNKDREITIDKIIKGGGMLCPTVSLVVKSEVYKKWPDFRINAEVYDYPLQLLAATEGRIFYFKDLLATYRFESDGSWTQQEMNSGVNWNYIKNEEKWLFQFDEYTNHKYHDLVTNRVARFYLINYIKHFTKELEVETRIRIKKISGLDHCLYSIIYYSLKLFGRPMQKFALKMKETLK